MRIIRILSGVLVVAGFVLGFMAYTSPQSSMGHTLIQAAAIILAGLLVSLAITENRRN